MAHAVLVSLLQILEKLQHHPGLYRYTKTIHDFQTKLCFLKYFIKEDGHCREYFMSDLQNQIRDAIHEAERIIESHISEDFLSSDSERFEEVWNSILICTQKMQSIIEKIDYYRQMATESMVEGQREVNNAGRVPSIRGVHREYPLVGRRKDIAQLRDRLKEETGSSKTKSSRLEVVPIVGVAGIGKTILAENVYNDVSVRDMFETRVWTKLSLKYRKRDVLIRLLHSMKKVSDKESPKTDDQLAKDVYNSLKSKKYLIVLDNVSREAWNDLQGLFPDFGKGSRIMLTTKSMDDVACFGDTIGPPYQLTPLSQDDSWQLLQSIVFDGSSRQKLKERIKIANKIAKNCQGLPLAIVIIGRLLSTESMTDWERIESSIQTCKNYVDLIEVVVSLSYKYLPQYLRECVLYMGIFPQGCEIPFSTLFKLWIAEGFVGAEEYTTLEEMPEYCLSQLVRRSLVSVCETSLDKKIKTCIINDVFLNFIMEKSKEERFFHIIDENANGFLEIDTNDQRRLCIHKKLHVGITDVFEYNKMASISTARSLIYLGPDPECPLRAWLDFKHFRVLHAPNIRFYSFPEKILELVQLRYLALSYNGKLPPSICKLRNLQFLIVLRYLIIKRGAPLYLPLEIWSMKELRHLQVSGNDLPDPSTATGGKDDGQHNHLLLENLSTLLDVSAHSCTPGVLQRIPNLKKLGIQIEPMSAQNAVETFSFLSHLFVLHRLESFKCIVTHPYFGSEVVPRILCAFPFRLKKIILSGCGFPWEYMSVIGSLPNLKVLKLRNYAFRGPEWESFKGEFLCLKYLLLEDMDIQYWWTKVDASSIELRWGQEIYALNFPLLSCLIIRHCYKLQVIPYKIGEIETLEMIELVDCSPSAPVVSAHQQIKERQWRKGNDALPVQVHFSWDD